MIGRKKIPERRREMVALRNGSVVDAYVGYRFWRFEATVGEVRLTSVWMGSIVWPREELEARCACNPSTMMQPGREGGHRCGIYAFSEPRYTLNQLPGTRGTSYVQGEVYLWGNVVHHERGYRASTAMIAGIYLNSDMDEVERFCAEYAAEAYGIPLIQNRLALITP